jgi:hypothetical protein
VRAVRCLHVGVAACELDDAREEHEAEEKPPREVAGQGRGIEGAARRESVHGTRKIGDQRAFEQKGVPLEIEEDLAGGDERQVAGPEEGKAKGLGDPEEEQHREQDSQAQSTSTERPVPNTQQSDGTSNQAFGPAARGPPQRTAPPEGCPIGPIKAASCTQNEPNANACAMARMRTKRRVPVANVAPLAKPLGPWKDYPFFPKPASRKSTFRIIGFMKTAGRENVIYVYILLAIF